MHVDVPGARVVRSLHDCTHQRRVLDEPVDVDVLPLADVRADAHRKLGVLAQAFVAVGAHAPQPTGSD